MVDDLNLNENKVTLDEDKVRVISYLDLGSLKTVLIKSNDGLYVTDPNGVIFIEILNVNKSRIINVSDKINGVANKKYGDNLSGAVISSNFDMKTYEIINLAPGTTSRSAVSKDQILGCPDSS